MKAFLAKHINLVCLLILLCAGSMLNAQVDTTEAAPSSLDSLQIFDPDANEVISVPADSLSAAGDTVIDPRDTAYHSPKKAVLLALIPGGGQIYNRKYWKLPIVYGALGACIYAVDFNQFYYKTYLDAFYSQIDENPSNDQLTHISERQLVEYQNAYRQDRDLMIIVTAGVYALSILDAYVDAHLMHYDISDDLTLRWEPRMLREYASFSTPKAYGLGLTLNLK